MTANTLTRAAGTTAADDCTPADRVTRSLLGYGVIAGPLYVGVSLVQSVTRDGFDLRRHAWSLLANGDLGWVQVTNFAVTGLMLIAAAVGLRRALGAGPAAAWTPRLIAAFGTSLLVAAVFKVHGLLALMEIQASRLPARTGPDGAAVLLPEQDRRRWDRLLIRRGLEALARAESLPAAIGPYTLQAGLAACHAAATRAEDTDWARIAAIYEVLARVWPTPVVELNRAVAVGMSQGPAAGLAIVDRLAASGALPGYPHLPAVRGDLLSRSGRHVEAREAFARAAQLTRNERELAVYRDRAAGP